MPRRKLTPEEVRYMRSFMKPTPPLAERLWAKVDKSAGPDGCWLWLGVKNSNGYGCIGAGGIRLPSGSYKKLLCHRVAWELAGNELPVWPMVIDHTCRNRLCVNPKHMRMVSQGVNSRENSNSQYAKNAAKTHCKQGHPFAGENLALYTTRKGHKCRICLTCQPAAWRHAVVPRSAPPNARLSVRDWTPEEREAARRSIIRE